jgi:protein-S-isoprenylcysteine O-methyltransferase Ste14
MAGRETASASERGRPIIPPPVLALALAGLMWAIARQTDIYPLEFAGRIIVAVSLAAAGLAIDLISVMAFIRARTTVNPLAPQRSSALVVRGLYRFSRNPMYLGMLLILIGWAAYLAEPLALAPVILFVVLIERMQILPEERALEEKFGDDYRAYKKRVRRWI